MKKYILLLTVGCLGFFAASAQQIPDISVENHKGETVQTAELIDGRTPAIITFWSTICKPCIQELDALSENFDDWQEEMNFRVIAVSVDDARSSTKAKALAGGRGWTDFELIYDKNQDFQRAMNVTETPNVFIMDATGKIVYSHKGYTPGSEIELFNKLKELCGN